MRSGFSTSGPLTYECSLMPTYLAVITSWVTPPPISRTDSNRSVIQGSKTANPTNLHQPPRLADTKNCERVLRAHPVGRIG
jgi:hypothetical protein